MIVSALKKDGLPPPIARACAFYSLQMDGLRPEHSWRISAHRILQGRDFPGLALPDKMDPEGLRALDILARPSQISNPKACQIGAKWNEARNGPLITEDKAGPIVPVQLIHSGKNFLVEEIGGEGSVRLAREFDLKNAGVLLNEALLAISVNLTKPKSESFSLITPLLKPLGSQTLTSVAEVNPNSPIAYRYTIFAARNPDKGSEFDKASLQARTENIPGATGDANLLKWLRSNRYGGVMLQNDSKEIKAHAFYQWQGNEAHIFSIYVPDKDRTHGIGSAITAATVMALKRTGMCERAVIGIGNNEGANRICKRLAICLKDDDIRQGSKPYVFEWKVNRAEYVRNPNLVDAPPAMRWMEAAPANLEPQEF